jgi:hypothetical protein
MIHERDKPKASTAIAVRPAAAIDVRRALPPPPAETPAPEAIPTRRRVPIHEKHLVSLSEATALGYPEDLLRMWKKSANPPGIWIGENKTTFRFSVHALRARVALD